MPQFEHALLACPENPMRQTLLERLDGAGAAVQVTTDGVQALEIVRVAPPQVAYVAAGVEGIGPFDLCRALANKGIAVVFLSEQAAQRAEALNAGAVEFLEMPAFVNEAGVVGKLLVAREKEPAGSDWFVTAKLSDFGCPALVRSLVAIGRNAIFTLERGDRSGEVRFFEGEVTSAQLGMLTGTQALHKLLLWQEAMVEVRFAPVIQRHQITLNRVELLAEIDRFLRDCAHVAKQIGSTKAVYEQDLARVAGVLERVPSEVGGLVRLFDGQRTVADVIQDSPFRPFDTIRVTGRLVEMGALKRILRGGSSQIPHTRPRKKPTTPVPQTVAKWLGTPPHPARMQRSTNPVVQAVLDTPAEPPNTLTSTPPLEVTLEPPVVLTQPKVPEAQRIAKAELSLEKRIEEALTRHAPAPPQPDRQGLAALVAHPVNPFGTPPPAVEVPRPPPPVEALRVATPAPPVDVARVATPTPPPPPAEAFHQAPPRQPTPPPVDVPPPPIPAPPVHAAPPAQWPPQPAPPVHVAPPPQWPPAPPVHAAPPSPQPAPRPVHAAPPPPQPAPRPAHAAPPPPQPAPPPMHAAPPPPAMRAPTPAPATRPAAPTNHAKPAFNDLEEEFFSKVDEHGNMPLPYDPVDSFDDLE
jgi:CheY-like chemotaxis protein